MIVYVETSYLIGIATGRDAGFGPPPPAGLPDFRLAIPSVCILEVFAWWEGEIRRRRQFDRTLGDQIDPLKRDTGSSQAHSLRVLLDEARVKNLGLLRVVECRLFGVTDDLSRSVELIPADQRPDPAHPSRPRGAVTRGSEVAPESQLDRVRAGRRAAGVAGRRHRGVLDTE